MFGSWGRLTKLLHQAVLNTYWCWFAMVRKEDQGKGLCQEMFNLTYEKVRWQTYGSGRSRQTMLTPLLQAKAIGATMGLITGSTHNVCGLFGSSEVSLHILIVAQVMIYEKMGLRLRGKEKMSSPWADWTFYSMSRDTMGE